VVPDVPLDPGPYYEELWFPGISSKIKFDSFSINRLFIQCQEKKLIYFFYTFLSTKIKITSIKKLLTNYKRYVYHIGMKKLKIFLKEKKITYRKLSAMVQETDKSLREYSAMAYSNWINGKRKWPYPVAAAIMTITDHQVLIKDLMGKNEVNK